MIAQDIFKKIAGSNARSKEEAIAILGEVQNDLEVLRQQNPEEYLDLIKFLNAFLSEFNEMTEEVAV